MEMALVLSGFENSNQHDAPAPRCVEQASDGAGEDAQPNDSSRSMELDRHVALWPVLRSRVVVVKGEETLSYRKSSLASELRPPTLLMLQLPNNALQNSTTYSASPKASIHCIGVFTAIHFSHSSLQPAAQSSGDKQLSNSTCAEISKHWLRAARSAARSHLLPRKPVFLLDGQE